VQTNRQTRARVSVSLGLRCICEVAKDTHACPRQAATATGRRANVQRVRLSRVIRPAQTHNRPYVCIYRRHSAEGHEENINLH